MSMTPVKVRWHDWNFTGPGQRTNVGPWWSVLPHLHEEVPLQHRCDAPESVPEGLSGSASRI